MPKPCFILKRAFSLIELLVVVSIISILAVIALPNFTEAQTRAKIAAVQNNMRVASMKFELLQIDTNRYPLAAKWRYILFWQIPVWADGDDIYDKFETVYHHMFGPHHDHFEIEALKRLRLIDYEWLGTKDGTQHFNNGFNFFNTAFIIKAMEHGSTWQDADIENWKALQEQAGIWAMYSPGPDLYAGSPSWFDGGMRGYFETGQEGYVEKELFHEYDPTNGTVSAGNIFRTQKNTAGLGMHPQFYE